MAANSDGNSEVTTVVTCEGDLSDPKFPAQFNLVIDKLNAVLRKEVKVHKLEPWNSVRVTLSIPREAALHLRQLANEGSQQLRALGILSVQVEGDQVISLQLADSVNSAPEEIILNTTQDGSGNGQTSGRDDSEINLLPSVARPLQSSNSETSNAQIQFKSPNVVCPSDSVVPRVSSSSATPSNTVSGGSKPFCGPFPFTSMNQAIHGGNREPNFNSLPPPYPGKHPPVTISSPLLVNLLQNDGTKDSISNLKGSQPPLRTIRTPPATQQKVSMATMPSTVTAVTSFVKPNNSICTQADIASSSVSLSALSANTSNRKQSSTLMTSTSNRTAIKSPPLLPTQYHRGIATTMVTKHAVTNSNVKIHAPLIESQTQSTLSISQHSQPSSGKVMRSNISQTNQTHGDLSTQPQHFSSAIRVSAIGSTVNSKSSQKILPIPQVKPSLLPANVPLVKGSVMSGIPSKSILNISTVNNNSLPTTARVPPSQVESLQNQEGNLLNQQVNVIENNLMQTVGNLNVSPQLLVTQGTVSPNTTVHTNLDAINSGNSNVNNILLRSLPSPPPYSVAISRSWDTSVNSNSLLDLTPSLTDLKPDELEELLPSLELTESPLPDLPDDFLNVNPSLISSSEELKVTNVEKRKFLINPLTGELEPQSSDESDHEEPQDVFTGLRSPLSLSDEDTCSTTRLDPVTDQSDNEARSVDKIPKLKNSRDRGRDSPSLKQEKIKLRLKLEKTEPVNTAYKVDVSYINNQPKKASMVSTTGEELRVPPLHISLRGRNSVVIKNKNKLNPDLLLQNSKIKKSQDHSRIKKTDTNIGTPKSDEFFEGIGNSSLPETSTALEQMKVKIHNAEQKKKKIKTGHENMEIIASLSQEGELKSKFFIHNHFKEKQKERRGSDSDLARNNKKYPDGGGILFDEKKRRLSQTDHEQPSVVGSTNVGTIAGLPQKLRKDKFKMRDVFKKDSSKTKSFCKIAGEKLQSKVVSLPVAGDMNMEAKFKQGLLEGSNEKSVVRPPHRTEIDNGVAETSKTENKLVTVAQDTTQQNLKQNVLDSEKCSTEIKSSIELVEKSTSVPGNRSPNTGGGQGEDSGIESMDALSEKSPNQASQSPHADIIIPKTQVPNILDIEAQLAKMEGLDRDTYQSDVHEHSTNIPTEDVNENKCHRDPAAKLNQCCELTCVLQDTLSQENESLSSPLESPTKQPDINLVPLKTKKDEDLEPVPVRITPALYTYSNPEKGRAGLESPAGLSDEDSNSCSTSGTIHNKPSKSLLEQLLIEIPNDHQSVPSSPSPATRLSVRTRALSKLESPELISPVPKNNQNNRTVPSTKRKRNESDSSNHSAEENVKKSKKKPNVHINDLAKSRHPADPSNANINKVLKEQDESSDSDEPLIEKMKKSSSVVNTQINNLVAAKTKVKVGPGNVANNNNKGWMVNTRRSVRGNISTQNNTRTKGEKVQCESEALRRKTRSTVVDVEKRKKEVK